MSDGPRAGDRMKIILAGGTGQVGRVLRRGFSGAQNEMVILSRQGSNGTNPRFVQWDGETLGDWVADFDGADVVINLTGRSVNCRYHQRNRREILESRVKSVAAIGGALRAIRHPPRVWLQASTATI